MKNETSEKDSNANEIILHLFFPLTFNFYVTNYLLLFERNLSISGVSKIPLHKKWNSEMHKKMEFPLTISSVNVTKSTVSSGF